MPRFAPQTLLQSLTSQPRLLAGGACAIAQVKALRTHRSVARRARRYSITQTSSGGRSGVKTLSWPRLVGGGLERHDCQLTPSSYSSDHCGYKVLPCRLQRHLECHSGPPTRGPSPDACPSRPHGPCYSLSTCAPLRGQTPLLSSTSYLDRPPQPTAQDRYFASPHSRQSFGLALDLAAAAETPHPRDAPNGAVPSTHAGPSA